MIARYVIPLVAGVIIFLVVSMVALYTATSNPQTAPRWWHSPSLGYHMLSVGLLPCSGQMPGQLIIGHNVMLSSRYPPPGLTIPTAPPCS